MTIRRQSFRKNFTPDQVARHMKHLQGSGVYTTNLALGETDASPCAIIFLDLCNFTNISRTLESRKKVEILQELFVFSGKTINKYHGTIDKYPGDGVVAYFPRLYFNDEEDRTVEWALDCATEIMFWFYDKMRWRHDLPRPSHALDLSIGIDAGWIEIAHLGSEFHSELILMGDEVNCASKCQRAASSREIIVGQGARENASALYWEHFNTGPAIGIVHETGNTKYLSHRFNWEKYAEESSWIDKDVG